jgi:Zn-finger nucleic acid-binding protein
MRCPQCGGDFDVANLQAVDGSVVPSKRCSQCKGFWFERFPPALLTKSVAQFDTPQPNYSLKNLDLICPNDSTLLQAVDHDDLPNGGKYWTCGDCEGTFFPCGQLALISNWQAEQTTDLHTAGLPLRTQASLATFLVALGGILTVVSSLKTSYNAADTAILPTAGPNIFALVLIALTYLAGTILAVLGRKLAIIITGWAVIVLCLFGFSVIIFS